jgi:hypothetical protein
LLFLTFGIIIVWVLRICKNLGGIMELFLILKTRISENVNVVNVNFIIKKKRLIDLKI